MPRKPTNKTQEQLLAENEDLQRRLDEAEETLNAIRNGEVVCIFAEGQITRIGQLLPFQRGFERIMKGLDAPIIPVAVKKTG